MPFPLHLTYSETPSPTVRPPKFMFRPTVTTYWHSPWLHHLLPGQQLAHAHAHPHATNTARLLHALFWALGHRNKHRQMSLPPGSSGRETDTNTVNKNTESARWPQVPRRAIDRAGRGQGAWVGVSVRKVKKVTFETSVFSRLLQPSFICPLSPEQTCPNFTLLHSRNGKHVTSLFKLLCTGLNVSPPSCELLAGGVVPDLSLSPQYPAQTGPPGEAG